ncbi:DNA endonuclease [Sporosarcina sp. FSL K6-1522]|uniref:DNA endonuclease n=1 Tax=Sporosarcina sp. FSL K6-1522 TaxID=2921554 RepID=UPI00315B1CC0
MLIYKSTLSPFQYAVFLASILGDGTLAKITKKSRRINSNYREHFGEAQLAYREWKVAQLDGLLYFNETKSELLSRSLPLFTELEQLFYNSNRVKRIPKQILESCILPQFLATLYMDDGSLSITYRINHRLKKIYLTPHIYLYLQSFSKSDLEPLRTYIVKYFKVNLSLSRRKDGFGHVLKTTTVGETFTFLQAIRSVILECPSMFYKSNWNYRFTKELIRYSEKYPEYEVLTSSSERSKSYSEKEIELLIKLKLIGYTDKDIGELLNRSYWSVVYKWSEIRKESFELIKK